MSTPTLSLKKLFLAILIIISSTVFAQQGTVRGFVYLKDTGEPVLFTNVILKGTTIGNATDVNGYFSITKFLLELTRLWSLPSVMIVCLSPLQ